MGAEAHAVFGDVNQGRQAEDLVASAVGESGPRPAHERADPACASDELDAGTEVEMIGIGEDYLGPQSRELLLGKRFYAGLGGNREKRRCVEGPAANGDAARPGAGGVGVLDAEAKRTWAQVGGQYSEADVGCQGEAARGRAERCSLRSKTCKEDWDWRGGNQSASHEAVDTARQG